MQNPRIKSTYPMIFWNCESKLCKHPNLRHDLSRLRIEILSNVMRKAQYPRARSPEFSRGGVRSVFAGRNRVAFFPGALEMLKTLSERYPVYALTNGNADASRTGISPYLKGPFQAPWWEPANQTQACSMRR